MKNDVSPRIQKLHNYLTDYSMIDSEFWYEGLSDVNYILATFNDKEVLEFSKELYGWKQHLLNCLSNAITYSQDEHNKPLRSYIYAHIFLASDDVYAQNIVDDFDFLYSADARIVCLLEPLEAKVKRLNHHEIVITACLKLLKQLKETLNV